MPTLETLPAEIKRLILDNISDVQSLRNLVHASPDYNAVYLSAQPEILTSVTLQELYGRGIDIFKTEPLVELIYEGKKLDALKRLGHYPSMTWKQIASALRQLRRHEKGLDQSRPAGGANVVLSVDKCLALLCLVAVVWIPAEVRNRKPYHLPNCKTYMRKERTEITHEEPENVLVKCRGLVAVLRMVYLDDVKEGYEKLTLVPLPHYRYIQAYWPGLERWVCWWLG